MTRSTVMLISVLAAALLPAMACHAQSQLQTDNARHRGGDTDGLPQLQTDTGRQMAEQDFMTAKLKASGASPGGGYPQGYGPGPEAYGPAPGPYAQQAVQGDTGDNGSVGRMLGAAAVADGINVGARYAERIIINRDNQPLQVGPDGMVRPAPNGGGDGNGGNGR